MTRMTGPDCVVMCNLINTHTHTVLYVMYAGMCNNLYIYILVSNYVLHCFWMVFIVVCTTTMFLFAKVFVGIPAKYIV